MKSDGETRGEANRNPGNINELPAARAWNGQVGLGDEWLPESQRRFARFDTVENGIRAIAGQLAVNQARYGCDTVRKQITRWAPPSDGNDTEAYVQAVARRMGVHPDARIDFREYRYARPAVEAIIIHENGRCIYDDATLDAGLAAYGITPFSERPAVETVADAARTDTGKGAIVLGAGGVVATLAQSEPAIRALGALTPAVALAVLACAVLAVLLWRTRRA